MTLLSKQSKVIDYLILTLIVGVSSIPILVGDIILIISGVFTGIVFFNRGFNFNKSFVWYLILFSFLFIVAMIKFGVFDISIILGFYFRLVYGYMAFGILHKKFVNMYINFMVLFSFISLLFYFSILIFPNIESFLLSNIAPVFDKLQIAEINRKHIGIFTIMKNSGYEYFGLKRNSGPFWEPGGFGVYLNFALLLYLLKDYKLYSFKFLIMLLALITTFSTGSLVVLMLISGLYINLKFSKFLPKFLFIILLISYSIWAFNNYSFLGAKMENDIYAGERGVHSRTGSFMADSKKIYENPLFGTSLFYESRFTALELTDADLLHRANGTSSLLTTFGLLGFLVYFLRMRKQISYGIILNYRSNKSYNSFYVLFIIIMLGATQSIYLKPFFLGLSAFFPLISDISNDNVKKVI